ncbi:unnamed protein product [Hermetia illucens]|uniref:Glycolipid transfer protein domain-containing protein n=1 Tax=Hermetia illucens TaxID=343691 RepID=A0A7R8UAU0_HERIL|nr:ceramide-1-phosphate transfer protein [Hermetia illucens]CAD7077357.1 unnamed protein product [Hermetia illucens]
MTAETFDLEKILRLFERSLHSDDDVLMDEYLEGYKEISKFFHLMGSVFSFVSSDVKSKIEILEEFRSKDNAEKFVSFRGMIEYEKHENLLTKPNYVSGSRTLLRLHRGLDFIREFLGQLPNLSPNEKATAVCQAAYNGTLAKHHPWIVRKSAVVAMYAMPTREDLLKKVCIDADKAIAVLPDWLNVTKMVYDRTENLYTVYDLHSLP